jgi:hypothetical protein
MSMKKIQPGGRKPQQIDSSIAPQPMAMPSGNNSPTYPTSPTKQGDWQVKQRKNQQSMTAPAPSVNTPSSVTPANPPAQAPQQKPVSNPYSLTNPMSTLEAAGAALAEHEANQPKPYQSKYGTQIQGLIDDIMGRDKFSYDPSADPLYQQYAQQYQRGGQLAMNDAMAQAAALTGGYGSSYSQTVGQQAYQREMENLAGMIPQLQQAAYAMYQDEGNELRNNLGMLQGVDATDYGRYRDDVGDYWAMMDYLYGKYSDWYPRAAEQYAMQQAGAVGGGGGSNAGDGNNTYNPADYINLGIGAAGLSSLFGAAQNVPVPDKKKK